MRDTNIYKNYASKLLPWRLTQGATTAQKPYSLQERLSNKLLKGIFVLLINLLEHHTAYFLMVKIPLGFLVTKWAATSPILNTWHVRSP